MADRHAQAASSGESGERPALTSISGEAAGALELDRIIHERVRLGVVSALAANESLTFNALKQLLGITDGNLSVHARKLEDAGYVACEKRFVGRVPQTVFRLTADGRLALTRYLAHMEAIIGATRAAERR